MKIRASLVLLGALTVGCGGDDAAPTDACALSASLSGALDRSVDYGDTDGCGGSYSAADRSRVLAYGGLGRLLVRVIVLQTDEDGVGTFSGRVEIVDEMDQAWATGDGECSIVISQNDFVEGSFGDARRIVGTATCTASAVADAANTEMQAVTIGPIDLYSCVLC
jgi:hypothetical protein